MSTFYAGATPAFLPRVVAVDLDTWQAGRGLQIPYTMDMTHAHVVITQDGQVTYIDAASSGYLEATGETLYSVIDQHGFSTAQELCDRLVEVLEGQWILCEVAADKNELCDTAIRYQVDFNADGTITVTYSYIPMDNEGYAFTKPVSLAAAIHEDRVRRATSHQPKPESYPGRSVDACSSPHDQPDVDVSLREDGTPPPELLPEARESFHDFAIQQGAVDLGGGRYGIGDMVG